MSARSIWAVLDSVCHCLIRRTVQYRGPILSVGICKLALCIDERVCQAHATSYMNLATMAALPEKVVAGI